MTAQMLILEKGQRKYVFRYTAGSEGQLMDQLWRLAEDPRVDLDWVDAAALSFQVLCRAGSPSVAPARSAADRG